MFWDPDAGVSIHRMHIDTHLHIKPSIPVRIAPVPASELTNTAAELAQQASGLEMSARLDFWIPDIRQCPISKLTSEAQVQRMGFRVQGAVFGADAFLRLSGAEPSSCFLCCNLPLHCVACRRALLGQGDPLLGCQKGSSSSGSCNLPLGPFHSIYDDTTEKISHRNYAATSLSVEGSAYITHPAGVISTHVLLLLWLLLLLFWGFCCRFVVQREGLLVTYLTDFD